MGQFQEISRIIPQKLYQSAFILRPTRTSQMPQRRDTGSTDTLSYGGIPVRTFAALQKNYKPMPMKEHAGSHINYFVKLLRFM